jgi:hypothetical protein
LLTIWFLFPGSLCRRRVCFTRFFYNRSALRLWANTNKEIRFNILIVQEVFMYNVSITRLRISSIFYVPLFILHAMRSGAQARSAQGIVHFSTRVEDPFTHWTKTVWQDEPTMKSFRNSGAHQRAMRILSEICSEASYTRWQQDSAEVPTWEAAHQALLERGVPSRLKHPSAFHRQGRTAPELAPKLPGQPA